MDPVELAVVMPVYNEANGIADVINEWLPALRTQVVDFRLLAVDDGSTDPTPTVLLRLQREHADQLIVLTRPNSGHGRACRTGYEAALRHGAKWILQIDSDGQCDPRFFPQFWNARLHANCIFGMRVQRDDGALRSIISTAVRFLMGLVTGCDLKDVNVPFRLIEKNILAAALQRLPPDFDLQNIGLTLALKRDTNSRWAFVPIRFRASTHPARLRLATIARKGFRMLIQIRKIGGRVSCGNGAI